MCPGPKDCFVGDGESYRGFVSETVDKHECLPWNSHLIPGSGGNFNDSVDGMGPHSYCRSAARFCVRVCVRHENPSPFGEICRFSATIGDIRESCRFDEKCFLGEVC